MPDLSQPTDRDVTVNGITLRLATWGDPTTPDRAVLLVHGITANSRAWSVAGPALAAAGFYAIAPDLRGRGRSAKPPHGYGIPYHVADLLAIADALDLPTLHLVGHSLGAYVALFLAAVHPGRVTKLVLVDGGGILPPDTLEAIGPALARLGVAHPSLDAYLAAMRQTTALPWDTYAETYYRYDAETHPDGTVTSTVPASAIAEEQAVNWTIRSDALPPFVRAPTLILRATVGLLAPDRGLILTPPEAIRLTQTIPTSRLVELPNTNHYTIITVPESPAALTTFLTGET